MKRVVFYNDFHNTKITLMVKGAMLSARQIARAHATLCGIQGCECGGCLGERGPGNPTVEMVGPKSAIITSNF